MICAIHQPNYFPWLGYFRKIALADVFVFLDEVPFPQTSRGTWINRVKFFVAGESRWFTVPMVRSQGARMINEFKINDESDWRRRFLKTLDRNYVNALYYKSLRDWIESLIFQPTHQIADFNITNIREICKRMGWQKQFVRQSELSDAVRRQLQGSPRLAEISKAVGADTYLAGDGAQGYEDLAVYKQEGISYIKTDFRHPVYNQWKGDVFTPGLSILDALFHAGPEQISQLIGERHQCV